MKRSIAELQPDEVVALAIRVEAANARRFRAFADSFAGIDDAVAQRFLELEAEEHQHEHLLRLRFAQWFRGPLPELDETDVRDVVESLDLGGGEHLLFQSLRPKQVFALALAAEQHARQFYLAAAAAAGAPALREVFTTLAGVETEHARWLEQRLAQLGPEAP